MSIQTYQTKIFESIQDQILSVDPIEYDRTRNQSARLVRSFKLTIKLFQQNDLTHLMEIIASTSQLNNFKTIIIPLSLTKIIFHPGDILFSVYLIWHSIHLFSFILHNLCWIIHLIPLEVTDKLPKAGGCYEIC